MHKFKYRVFQLSVNSGIALECTNSIIVCFELALGKLSQDRCWCKIIASSIVVSGKLLVQYFVLVFGRLVLVFGRRSRWLKMMV